MKKGTAKKNDLRERIRQDLLDQLESDGTVGEYYIDLVGDYMSMWDTKNELMEDTAARGAVVEYTSNTGVSNMKRNESIDQQLKVNAQMLKLLDALGIKPSTGGEEDEL